jgi:hypothetical protein
MAALRDRIVFSLAIVFRRPLLCSDPFPLPEQQKRDVDRSFVQLQNPLAHLLDPAGEPMAMLRPQCVENFQDRQIKRPL